MSRKMRAACGLAIGVAGLALLVGILFVTNTSQTNAADKDAITKFLTNAIQSNYEQEMLPPGLQVSRVSASDQGQLRSSISVAHRQYFGGAALTKVLARDLSWADRVSKEPTSHTLEAKVSDVAVSSLKVVADAATVVGTFMIYHKDAQPVDAAGHEMTTGAWNTMSFTAQLDRTSGHWLIVEWQADLLATKEDSSARSGDEYLPKEQAKPTLPQLVPAPLNP